MVETKPKKNFLKYFFILIGIVALIFLMSISMARTSTTEYCISCHEMKKYNDELKKSSHYLDSDKNPIQCKQCHIPKNIGPKYLTVKTVLGMKDMFVHYFGDSENLDRRRMQKLARRFIPDENCLACHKDLKRDVKNKKISEIGRLCHEAYEGKNGNVKRNCAGCHFNMAHLPDFDRRFFFNAEFAERLPLKKENK